MPTYVYACDSCSAQFEQFQSFKDAPLQTCPSCSASVRRVFQPVGIVFKGSGWYITDSRKTAAASPSSDGATAKAEKATTEKATTEKATTEQPSTASSSSETSGGAKSTSAAAATTE